MTRSAVRPLPKAGGHSSSSASLSELRRLIVGPEAERLLTLERDLGDPERQAQAIARALPRAVTIRTSSDRQLHIATEPVVAHALREVVRKDPEQLADALFPIVGRAVRKAVAAAFAALVERVSAAVEHTFTLQGLRYRLEAARTRRPVAEIVLRHSLLFRVEHVFLLHRPTGLLLAHASAEANGVQDPEMVAAMFSVIEGYVRETLAEREPLTQFEVGDLAARIEYGPSAMLVALVRGTVPTSLAAELRDALERIHVAHRDVLVAFRGGDTQAFVECQPTLEACLLTGQRARRPSARPRVVLALVCLLALGLALAASASVVEARRADHRLRELADALAAEPGIVLLGATREGQDFALTGLRDPLAREPRSVLAARGLDLRRTTLRFEPYFSTDRRLLARRLTAAIAPPSTVVLTVEGDAASAAGVASREWLQRARLAVGLLPGLTSLDVTGVREQEAIAAVDEAARVAERAVFHFPPGEALFDPSAPANARRFDALAAALEAILANAPRAGVHPRFELDGSSDRTGTEARNEVLSRSRAEAVRTALVRRGVPESLLRARGAGEAAKDIAASEPSQGRDVRVKVSVAP